MSHATVSRTLATRHTRFVGDRFTYERYRSGECYLRVSKLRLLRLRVVFVTTMDLASGETAKPEAS